jgi:GDPmannose 4,6-dehydratase
MTKKVIITGCSGQDGSYMVDYLLENTDHQIFGVVRRSSKPDYSNLTEALKNPRFQLVVGDLSDSQSMDKVVEKIVPDYFINLGAQSFVKSSWDLPEQTMDINATGTMRCLEAIVRHAPNCRFYNAGSSEEFGNVEYSPQDEKHPAKARSPYGASKVAARQIVKTYRESFNLYAIQGYLFNHESPRRGEEFVTRKITKGVARIKYALDNNLPFQPIELGSIDSKRDWSHAKDFVDGIWKMLNQEIYRSDLTKELKLSLSYDTIDAPTELDRTKYWSGKIKEYVLSSNETHGIKEFIELSFKNAGFFGNWIGKGADEKYELHKYLSSRISGFFISTPVLVSINPEFYRPADVEILLGDSTLARKELGWTPKYSFNDLVKEMLENDIKTYAP